MSLPNSNYEQITRNILIDGDDDSPYYDGLSYCHCSNLNSSYDQTCTTKVCFNYMTLTECLKCSSTFCQNNKFQKMFSMKLDVRVVENKGCGLFCLEDIQSHQFIKEYVGEIVSSQELQKRFVLFQFLLTNSLLSLCLSLSLSLSHSLSLCLSLSHSLTQE
jgi:hypothetical protein